MKLKAIVSLIGLLVGFSIGGLWAEERGLQAGWGFPEYQDQDWNNPNDASTHFVRAILPQGNLTHDTFDDTPKALESLRTITWVRVRGGDIIDQIQVSNGKVDMPAHGGEGGKGWEFRLDRGDVLTRIWGTYGNWYGNIFISQLFFGTAHGRVYGPFGKNGGIRDPQPFSLEAPMGWQIIALIGSTSDVGESDGRTSSFLSALGASLIKY